MEFAFRVSFNIQKIFLYIHLFHQCFSSVVNILNDITYMFEIYEIVGFTNLVLFLHYIYVLNVFKNSTDEQIH